MYHWKCLEKIARGDHTCTLACIVDDDGENQGAHGARANEILQQLYDTLSRLADDLQDPDGAFAVPENGFKSLAELLKQISQAVEQAETNAASSGLELRLLPEVTAVGTTIAIAIEQTAGSSSTSADPGVTKTPWRVKAAGDFVVEFQLWRNFYLILFDKEELQLQKLLYLWLSELGQKVIAQAASTFWDELLECLRRIKDPETRGNPLDDLQALIRSASRNMKDLVRLYALDSMPFKDLAVLARVHLSGAAVSLDLDEDADLRARNLGLRPNLFKHNNGPGGSASGDGSGGGATGCSVCASEEEFETASGKVDQNANDDFLTFPGQFDGKAIKPLIDTGGGCNLVKAEWLEQQNIKVDESVQRFQTLLMADGSTSKKCPCLEVKWSFDGRKKRWTNVEFVVVPGYKYDALIGLPFLKHTETIHNSAGRLVFPEFKGVHAKKDSIPMYNFGVKAST